MKRAGFVAAIGFGLLCAMMGARPLQAQTVQMQGMVAAESRELASFGDLPATQGLPLQISFKPRNQGELDSLIAAQQDPESPLYHQWLSSEEFTRRFGPTEQGFDKVSRWLSQQGFQVTGGSPSEGVIRFNGEPLTIFRTFNTRVAKFSPDGARFASISEPEIPAEYADLVGTIGGLDNLHAFVPMAHRAELPRLAASSFGANLMASLGFGASLDPSPPPSPIELASVDVLPSVVVNGRGPSLGPSDFNVFYNAKPLKDQGIIGTSGCIAIVGNSNFSPAAVAAFNSQFGLPDNSALIAPIATSGNLSDDETEMLLDLEWSHAVAPGAAIKFAAAGDIVEALRAAVNDNSCSVISISFRSVEVLSPCSRGPFTALRRRRQRRDRQFWWHPEISAPQESADPTFGCVREHRPT